MSVDWKTVDGKVASVELVGQRSKHYSVVFTYELDGEWYGGTFSTIKKYNEGDSLPVSYDPAHPDRNTLVRGEYRLHWLIGIFLTVMVILALLRFLL